MGMTVGFFDLDKLSQQEGLNFNCVKSGSSSRYFSQKNFSAEESYEKPPKETL